CIPPELPGSAVARPVEHRPLSLPEQVEFRKAIATIPSGIHFALARHDLTPLSQDVIRRFSEVLLEYPHVRVELEGHTGSRGSVAYNLALSQRRAASVQAALEAAGVDSSRISATYAGKSKLLTAEKDVRDLALNRRVDFKYHDERGNEIAQEKQTGDLSIE